MQRITITMSGSLKNSCSVAWTTVQIPSHTVWAANCGQVPRHIQSFRSAPSMLLPAMGLGLAGVAMTCCTWAWCSLRWRLNFPLHQEGIQPSLAMHWWRVPFCLFRIGQGYTELPLLKAHKLLCLQSWLEQKVGVKRNHNQLHVSLSPFL
jgi:hypothetical protein